MTTMTSRSFSFGDQEAFARLSGDRNPLHMDEAVASLSQAGSRVVHGVHCALWMLEELEKAGLDLHAVAKITVRFVKFIKLDTPVHLKLIKLDSEIIDVEANTNGSSVVNMRLHFCSGSDIDFLSAHPCSDNISEIEAAPLELDFEAMGEMSGWLRGPSDQTFVADLFPSLCAIWGSSCVCSIALMSSVVGMIVPGRYSIFSSFFIVFRRNNSGSHDIAYRVLSTDSRFRMSKIGVSGPYFFGELVAFMRYAPIATPSMIAVSKKVTSDQFKDRRALVIGGSRGIGAVTAKLIAAGGGRVTLTYVTGADDARSLQADINTFCGEDRCSIACYNVHSSIEAAKIESLDSFTNLYYYATPNIMMRSSSNLYIEEKFIEFIEIYVNKFYDIIRIIMDNRPSNRPFEVLYASSAALNERPKLMTEYAMAKAAGEILCADLTVAYPQMTITTPRLPRILTNQTAIVPPVASEDALTVIAPLLTKT